MLPTSSAKSSCCATFAFLTSAFAAATSPVSEAKIGPAPWSPLAILSRSSIDLPLGPRHVFVITPAGRFPLPPLAACVPAAVSAKVSRAMAANGQALRMAVSILSPETYVRPTSPGPTADGHYSGSRAIVKPLVSGEPDGRGLPRPSRNSLAAAASRSSTGRSPCRSSRRPCPCRPGREVSRSSRPSYQRCRPRSRRPSTCPPRAASDRSRDAPMPRPCVATYRLPSGPSSTSIATVTGKLAAAAVTSRPARPPAGRRRRGRCRPRGCGWAAP